MPECVIDICHAEAAYTATLVTTNAHNPDNQHNLPVAYCAEHLASQQKICNGYDGIDLTDVKHVWPTTTETICRRLLCGKPATVRATVTSPTSVHKVAYCDRHFAAASEQIEKYEGASISNARPIEKGTTMTNDLTPEGAIKEIERLTTDLASARQTIIDQEKALDDRLTIIAERNGLEADVTRQAQMLAARSEQIDEKERINAEQAQTIIDLEHTVSQQKATNISLNNDVAFANDQIADLKRGEKFLKNQNASLTTVKDALIRLLHGVANTLEDAGEAIVYVDTIDDRLEELSLPGRKSHFEMIFTVPVQMRVEGDYVSADSMRQAFHAGEINWNVGDHEDTIADEIKILDVVEMKP